MSTADIRQAKGDAHVVVFDLDGTLLEGDSTACWIVERLTRAPLRLMAALAVSPFASLLLIAACTRRWGASAFLWIASAGLDEEKLRQSLKCFAQRAAINEAGVRWRVGGLATLRSHLEAGHQVVIATAAPSWLAIAMLDAIGCNLTVIGSSLRRRSGGWVGGIHCRAEVKCDAVSAAVFPPPWLAAYADAVEDYPLLARSQMRYLVGHSDRISARLARAGLSAERTLW